MCDAGASAADATRRVVLVDSRGLVAADRIDLDPHKTELALPVADVAAYGLTASAGPVPLWPSSGRSDRPSSSASPVSRARSRKDVIREMARHVDAPIVMPLSNPTSTVEALPSDVLAWTGGRALVATGSPFPPITTDAGKRVVAQANNVFVFPGVGLGAIVAAAPRHRRDVRRRGPGAGRFGDRRSPGERCPYPPIGELRTVSRSIARAVAGPDHEADVDAAMWWPDYVPYLPIHTDERRRGEQREERDMTGRGSSPFRAGSPVRAAVLEQVGAPAVIRELDLRAPRAGEVRVRMLASGVCHSDLHVRDGEWDRPTPIVMGHEKGRASSSPSGRV